MPCGSSKDACNLDRNAANGHCAFEDLDHSVLQQPLNLGVTNIKQILKCVESGSKEIKDIILNECNVIYECKACVGLFRSLANFMYHKRCYCKKHMCEDMLLFDNFEEETITVQPEAPKEKMDDTTEESAMDLNKSDIAEEIISVTPKDIKSTPETPSTSKDKNAAASIKGKAKETVEFKKPESTMISRRTRDKNAQNPVSSSSVGRISVRIKAPEEPPLKCAKMVPEKIESKSAMLVSDEPTKIDSSKDTSGKVSDEHEEVSSKEMVCEPSGNDNTVNKQNTPTKEIKTKKIEFSKISGMLEKSMPSFPKIIFKTIESNQNAVFQSDEKKKLETFGLAKKFETATVETKVDNDKLIIVLKKDVNKTDSSSDSKTTESYKQKSDSEKTSDFHLTRRKRLIARTDCDVHELKCLVCKTQFMSLKTLYFHMLSLHSKKRLYYPCPFCKTLFVQMYGVSRHLISIHNKTKDQIVKLREVIKKKSVWKKIDDVNPAFDKIISPLNYQIKEASPPPEIKNEPPKEPENENNDSPDSLKAVIKLGKNATLHQCTKCNRVFGRKSSQVSHQKFCIMNAPIKTEGSDTPPPQASSPIVHPSPSAVSQTISNQSVVSFLSLSPTKSPVSSKSPSIMQFKHLTTPVKSTPVQKQVIYSKISNRPKRGAEKQMHKDFVNSQTLKWRSANRIDTNVNVNKAPPPPKKNPKDSKNLEKKVLGIMNAEDLTCLKCDKKFSSYSNLRRHVAIHVGWTRFKCKFCDYQAYNKSQCWAHVQKAHAVDEDEMDKSIVNLVNSNASNKKSQLKGSSASSSKHNLESSVKISPKTTPIPKVKISKKKVMSVSKISDKKQLQIQKIMNDAKVEKKQLQVHKVLSDLKKAEKKQLLQIQKKEALEMKKYPDVQVIESKKEKPQPAVPVQKIPKDSSEAKKEKSQATVTFHKLSKKEGEKEIKKERSHHIIPIQKLTIPRETNYKSVTTSNPTTIILSKKIPTSTVQSIVTISPDSVSSTSKISPIRTSPRKTEIKGPGERLITTLVTRSSAYTKTTPIQIKLPVKSSSVDELPKESPEKNCSKKERLISEWFPKKDLSSSTVRRESAPLIIGLVPAGLNAREKSPGMSPEKPASSSSP